MESELKWEEPTTEELAAAFHDQYPGNRWQDLSPEVRRINYLLWTERIALGEYVRVFFRDLYTLAKAVRFEQSALARYETLVLQVEELVGPEHERPPKHWRDLWAARDAASSLLTDARFRVAEFTAKVLGPAA